MSGMLGAALQAAANLVAYPIYIRFLGYEQYGVWLTLATLIGLMQLGIAGIGPAITQLVAEADAHANYRRVGSCVTWAALLTLAITALLTLAAFPMAPGIASLFSLSPVATRDAIAVMPLIALLSGFFLWVETFSAVLSGLGRMDQTNIVTAGGQSIVVVVAYLLLRRGLGIHALVYGYFAGRTAVNITVLLLIRQRYVGPLFIVKNLDPAELWTLLKVSGSIASGSLFNLFLSPFNKWIIAANVGVSAVPVYEIAFGASMQLRSFVELGLRALVPEISRVNAQGGPEVKVTIKSLFRLSLGFSAACGTVIYLIAGGFAYPIFGVWLHKLLDPTQVLAFRILLAGSFGSLLGTPAYYCLIGMRALRPVFLAYAFQVGVNVMVTITVLFAFRVTTAAVCAATSLGMIVAGAYLVSCVEQRLRAHSLKDGTLTAQAG
jgi:O-antigen/teichoic acid export membrane protein